jgi:hypothetical protein
MIDRMLAAGSGSSAAGRRGARRRCAGATTTDSAAVVAAVADVLIVCVFSDEQLLDVALGDDGLVANMAPGSVLALHTTGSPSTARTLAEAGAPRHVHVVDAPVSGTDAGIAQGKLTVMLGGEPADRDRVRAVVATYSDHVSTFAPRHRQCVKLVNNAVLLATADRGDAERRPRARSSHGARRRPARRAARASLSHDGRPGGTEKAVSPPPFPTRTSTVKTPAELGLDSACSGRCTRTDPLKAGLNHRLTSPARIPTGSRPARPVTCTRRAGGALTMVRQSPG